MSDPRTSTSPNCKDAFFFAELMYYETLGFCAPGDAIELLRSGATSLGGSCPVNPPGGLLSRGDPIEAVVWLASHLAERGRTIRRGMAVSSGALTSRPVPAEPGTYQATSRQLGHVWVKIT